MRLKLGLLLCAIVLPALAVPALAQSVGVTAAVNQTAVGMAPAQKPRTMVLGDQVIHNEKISTNGKGLLQILLADGTSFTVGPNSSMVIDSFVYDPDADTAKVVATLGKGVFRFIGGRTSKSPDGAQLITPVGTVGIRGGISDLDFSGHKGTPFHIDMLFGDSITLTHGGTLLGRLFQNGYSISIGSNNQVVITRTPPGWTQGFQSAFSGNGGHHSGGPGPTQVATALQGKGWVGPPVPTTGQGAPGPTPSLVATTQPPPLFTPPDLTSGNATWAEINNSSLANAAAFYTGDFNAMFTYSYSDNRPSVSQTVPTSFELGYYFGSGNGSGVVGFQGHDNDDDYSPPVFLEPTDPTGVGTASFAGATGYDDGPSDSYHLGVTGQFVNTGSGVAQGVAGDMDLLSKQAAGDAIETTTGTGHFGGSLAGTVPLGQCDCQPP